VSAVPLAGSATLVLPGIPNDRPGDSRQAGRELLMPAPKPMLKTEIERREEMALMDLAATARYHASRLPSTSKWHATFVNLATRLEPAPQDQDEEA
jgi:hypothetical protein